MSHHQDFKDLLVNLQHADNDCRNSAETAFNGIEAQVKFDCLLQVIGDVNADVAVRVFAGVLCRRLLDGSYEEAFGALPVEAREACKERLLRLVEAEDADVSVRRKVCEVVVEVAKEHCDDAGNLLWPQLLSLVFERCLPQAADAATAICGLQLLTALPHMLGDRLPTHLEALCGLLARSMGAPDWQVREAAVGALASLAASQAEEPPVVQALASLVPLLLHTTADCLQARPDSDLCLKALVDLADSAPDLLRAQIDDLLLLCTNILHNETVAVAQRHLAVEIFVSLAENCPAAVRKCTGRLQALMTVLFKMLTELDDDPDWASQDVEEEEDDESPSIVAEMALDRVSCAMRGKRILQEVTHTVPAMLHSARWQERHGGLMAISSVAEGLNKVMGEILGSVLDEVVPLLADQHPRVRYAACNAVGQLSTDFGHKLQKAYHAKVLPALMAVLDDDRHPRVQAYAGAAMVNFCEAAPKSVLLMYVPALAERLLHVLRAKHAELAQGGRRLVLEQVVTTVAAVADSAGEHFEPYYDGFMGFLKGLMAECRGHDSLRLLRGKTAECVSLMGLAVGRGRFLADADEVMQLLLLQEPRPADDDPQHSYLISAWVRICKILGKDFAQFLPLVMAEVLRTASIKTDVCMMYDEEVDGADKDWQVVKIADDQNFAIHTSGLDDKATACQMLVCYARELSEAFCPYVLEVAEIMIPLLTFYFNEDVRSSAADIVPHLLECSLPLGPEVTASLWQRTFGALMEAIPQEPYREQAADMLDAVAEGVKLMGRTAVSREQMARLVAVVEEQFQELSRSQQARSEKRRGEEYDEDDDERLEAAQDEDDQVLCKLVDLMHALLQVYAEEALPVFDQLLPHVVGLLDGGRPWTDLQYGLCFWDDLVETVGAASWPYGDHFLPAVLAGLTHGRKEVRQAAAYGCGVMAMHGGPAFAPVLQEAAPLLAVLADSPYGRNEELNMATENAVSALAKVAKYRPECAPGGDLEALLAAWVAWLPVWEDREDTPHVYGLLCDLLETGHPSVHGGGLPHAVRAIVFCWHRDGMAPDCATFDRCRRILADLRASDLELFGACVGLLSQEEQATLVTALGGESVPS